MVCLKNSFIISFCIAGVCEWKYLNKENINYEDNMKLRFSIAITIIAVIAFLFEVLLASMYFLELLAEGKYLRVIFFSCLMVLTVAAAVLAPICAGIEILVNHYYRRTLGIKDKDRKWVSKNFGTFLFVLLLLIITIFLVANQASRIVRILDIWGPSKEIDLDISLHEEQIISEAIAQAQGMVDDPEKYKNFTSMYSIYEGGMAEIFDEIIYGQKIPKMMIFTPYTTAVLSVYDTIRFIEHDNYSIDRNDVRNILKGGDIHSNLFNLEVSKPHYEMNISDFNTYIEYEGGSCDGEVYKIDDKTSEFKGQLNYTAAVYSRYPLCYYPVQNKTVKFVFEVGDSSVSYDVDMREFK